MSRKPADPIPLHLKFGYAHMVEMQAIEKEVAEELGIDPTTFNPRVYFEARRRYDERHRSDPTYRERQEAARARGRRWRDYFELAAAIMGKAHAGKRTVLSPDTALMVASALVKIDEKPTRDEIARMICRQRCETPCYECCGRANVIVRAYGCRIELSDG